MNAVKEAVISERAKRKSLTTDQVKALLAQYASRRIRKGKSSKDRANGARSKNAQNKDSRASWQNNRRADGSNSTTFPRASCNGKANRYQVTGKDGQTVYVR